MVEEMGELARAGSGGFFLEEGRREQQKELEIGWKYLFFWYVYNVYTL